MQPIEHELLTSKDAAVELRLTSDRVRQLAKSGQLPAKKTRGGQYIFDSVEVHRLKTERAHA